MTRVKSKKLLDPVNQNSQKLKVLLSEPHLKTRPGSNKVQGYGVTVAHSVAAWKGLLACYREIIAEAKEKHEVAEKSTSIQFPT